MHNISEYVEFWDEAKNIMHDPLYHEQKASDALSADTVNEIEEEIFFRDKISVPDISFRDISFEARWDIYVCHAGLKYVLIKDLFCPMRVIYQEWQNAQNAKKE